MVPPMAGLLHGLRRAFCLGGRGYMGREPLLVREARTEVMVDCSGDLCTPCLVVQGQVDIKNVELIRFPPTTMSHVKLLILMHNAGLLGVQRSVNRSSLFQIFAYIQMSTEASALICCPFCSSLAHSLGVHGSLLLFFLFLTLPLPHLSLLSCLPFVRSKPAPPMQ